MAVYNTIAGLVQFDVQERTAGDQSVRDVVVQAIGSGGKQVKITLWPEFSHVAIEKGDFIVAQGKFTTNTVNGKEYLGLSANGVYVGKAAAKSEDDVANPVSNDDEEELLF